MIIKNVWTYRKFNREKAPLRGAGLQFPVFKYLAMNINKSGAFITIHYKELSKLLFGVTIAQDGVLQDSSIKEGSIREWCWRITRL